jgi:hypothetical protein
MFDSATITGLPIASASAAGPTAFDVLRDAHPWIFAAGVIAFVSGALLLVFGSRVWRALGAAQLVAIQIRTADKSFYVNISTS